MDIIEVFSLCWVKRGGNVAQLDLCSGLLDDAALSVDDATSDQVLFVLIFLKEPYKVLVLQPIVLGYFWNEHIVAVEVEDVGTEFGTS